jgi:hypothetical protein
MKTWRIIFPDGSTIFQIGEIEMREGKIFFRKDNEIVAFYNIDKISGVSLWSD